MNNMLQTTIDVINGFSKLSDGWFYGRGKAPTQKTIDFSIKLLNDIILLLPNTHTSAYPGEQGEIMLSFYDTNTGVDLEILIYGDLTTDIICNTEDEEICFEEEIPFDQTKEKIEWIINEYQI